VNGQQTSRMSRRAVLEGLGIGALGLTGAALLGCGGGGDSGGGTGAPAAGRVEGPKGSGIPMTAPNVVGKPRYGGTYRVASTSIPTQHDPHTALGQNIWHVIGEKVLEIHPQTGQVLPHVATSWEVADPNGLTLVFKIQPGIKTHKKPPWNGRDFTAEDVAWNIERIGGLYAEREKIPLSSFQRASMVANLVKAEAVDKTTVRATLSRPNSAFFNGLTENRVPMMPVEMLDVGLKDPMKMGGIGPFEVVEHSPDKRETYKKFGQYFRKGEPYFDTYEAIVVPDTAATQATFISGETQITSVGTPDALAVIRRAKPDALIYTWLGSPHHLRPHVTGYAPFRDFRVRKGIFLAIDYAAMNNSVVGDGWGYHAALFPGFPEAWKPDKVKTLPGYNPDTKAQDIAEGQKLLAAAGYPNGKGIDFEIMISGTTGAHMENSTIFQAQMAKVFPEMKISLKGTATSAEMAVPLAEGRFQMNAYVYTPVPDAVLEFTSQHHTQGSRNYTKFSDKTLDDLMDRAIVELNVERRKELLDETQRRFMDEWLTLWNIRANPVKNALQADIGAYDTTAGIWFQYGSTTKVCRWYYVDK
jgi:peptide/nickel transport system substrate-binding protein